MAGALGSTPGIIVGVGVGAAAAAALDPAVEIPKQEAWRKNPNRILDAGLMARLVAQGGIALELAQDDAQRDGYDSDKLDALVYLAQTVPAVAEALNLWRRGLLSDELWRHVLVKSGLDQRYVPGLTASKLSEPLDPSVVAVAIQRGIIRDPGFLPVGPPAGEGKVPRFPVSSLDPLEEAAASGVARERLFVNTAIVGNPLSLQQAASAFFRGIIERPDYDRAVSEGNTRNEWGAAALEQSRAILTPHDAAELELRGYLTREERLQHTAEHGMAPPDSDLLYDLLGRSIPVHAITTGEARGGHYDAPHDGIPEAYLRSLQRGNLRPEYYSLAYANRYSYPSAFFFRILLQAGELTAEQGQQAFEEIGWSPEWAKRIAEGLAAGAGEAADANVRKAQTQLWSSTHRSYIAEESGDGEARERFALLGIEAAAAEAILELWKSERELVRKQLTPAQVKKALHAGVTNPATGRPWTHAEAMEALLARGYARQDAEVLLAE